MIKEKKIFVKSTSPAGHFCNMKE